MTAFGYLFHNSDYSPCMVGQLSKIISRQTSFALRVECDTPVDRDPVWLFRGLSTQRVNSLFQVLSCAGKTDSIPNKMNHEDLQQFFTPYDAMPFTTSEEHNLFVAYSIKDISSPVRQMIMGPDSVSLYEKGIPHFGPIYVFKAQLEYDDDGLAYHMLDIKSSANDILCALEYLNFGG